MTRKTKIICTIGPAINSEAALMTMFKAGMDVARINFSHGSHSDAIKQMARIRNASAKINKHVGIMVDTKGPEIRTGLFENGCCEYKKGDKVKIVSEEVLGNKDRFYVTCVELFDDLKPNDAILVDDGNITLRVLDCKNDVIECCVENDGIISDRKGINVPGVKLSMPFISERDYNDIKFGCEQGADLLALSFVRRKEDVIEVKELVKSFNRPDIEIIAKIENQEGLDDFERILSVADGIMVARGDMGVELPTEMVPYHQKRIIKLANAAGKPVITATHMLESMIHNPRPTRAETSDVANAILDGSDAIMLSGESAIGKYPVESVLMMDKIARIAESMINYRKRLGENVDTHLRTQNDAIGICVSECALALDDVVAIIAFTETGGSAKRICRFRPSVPIIACTDVPETCRRLSYYCGVFPIIAKYVNDISLCDDVAIEVATSLGFEKGSKIILTGGFGQKHGITNTIRIIEL